MKQKPKRQPALDTRKTPPPQRMQGKCTQGDRQELREKGLNFLSEVVASNSFGSPDTKGDW